MKHLSCIVTCRILIFLLLSQCVFINADAQRRRGNRNKNATTRNVVQSNKGVAIDESIANSLAENFVKDNTTQNSNAVKTYYNTLNNEGKQTMIDTFRARVSQALEAERKNEAATWITLYNTIAPRDDEKLPAMLYVQGTIFTENLDSVNLKATIAQLEKLPKNSDVEEFSKKLTDNLQRVSNYQAPYKLLSGYWVADGLKWRRVDHKGSVVNSVGENNHRFIDLYIDAYYDELADTLSFTLERKSQVVDDIFQNQRGLSLAISIKDLHSSTCIPTNGDSLFVLWSSERLSKGNLKAATTMRKSITDVTTNLYGEFAQTNKYNFGQQLLGGIATIGIDMVSNALVSAFTEPHKRMYLLEGRFKIENDLHLRGHFNYKFWDVIASGNSDYIELESEDFDLVQWLPSSGIAFYDWKHFNTGSSYLYLNPTGLFYSEEEYKSYSPHHKSYNITKNKYVWTHEQFKHLVLYNDSVLTSRGIKSNLLQDKEPDLGIKFIDLTEKEAKKNMIQGGAIVKKAELGAARFAGIKKKDIITSVNGNEIHNANHFQQIIKNAKIGDWIYCEVLRKKERLTIPIRVTFNTRFEKVKK